MFNRVNLFQLGEILLHSGDYSYFKIECDALSKKDWYSLALMFTRAVPRFGAVEGVPSGGLILAGFLKPFITEGYPLLIVDDVLTTGSSMEEHRAGRDAIGAVVFARGPVPSWVTPLFTMKEGI